MDSNLKRSMILEHYQNPVNRGLIDNDSYYKSDTTNDSCIDEIHLMAHMKNGVIDDIRFDGEACAICTSSTSIMIHTLLDKDVVAATNIINDFKNMIDEKEYDAILLEDAIVYDDVYKQPNRKKCALLPWWGMEHIITDIKKEEGSK